ncbi:MAG: response regulator transcription factor [Sulfobacillus sp.]
MRPIRLLIVDDHPVVREGLAAMFRRSPDVEVAGEAGDGQEAVSCYRTLRPDVVLMDLRIPLQDGLSATREILRHDPGAKVVVLTTFAEEGLARRVLQAGAKGVWLKDASQDDLMGAVRAAAQGSVSVHPLLAASLTESGAEGGERAVSGREMEILQLVASGRSNKEIAAGLYLTENTVKTHLANLFAKLGVHDRAEAVTEGHRRGFLGDRPNG